MIDPITAFEMSLNPTRVNRLTLLNCFFFAFHSEVEFGRLKAKLDYETARKKNS